MIDTTVGRVIFNQHLPKGMNFVNDIMNKSKLSKVINECYKIKGHQAVIKLLDDLKKVGFEEATKAGLSISINDLKIPEKKQEYLDKTMADWRCSRR